MYISLIFHVYSPSTVLADGTEFSRGNVWSMEETQRDDRPNITHWSFLVPKMTQTIILGWVVFVQMFNRAIHMLLMGCRSNRTVC